MDPKFLFYIFSLLRGKLLVLLIILCVSGYFLVQKYNVGFIQNNPKFIVLKENVEKIKSFVSR